ncbi:GCY protein [Arthroderma uncinatum]|uniref:GCY protein n=1 Tax=Arthroderma uncinatum TaxID=74035 RepID=UPI00144AD6AE|nr:GCY protein [Arthroderma uncinatum]KAF3481832.1 GCY protein [Arthroderma uncinatum]
MSEYTFKLNTGQDIPGLGFGTFDPKHPEKAYDATLHALRVGYRHLDCAALYINEELVGNAIHDFLQSRPDVHRKDLFITTKAWNHMHEPEDVEKSIKECLRKLRLDYVDLFLLHYPIATEKDENGEQAMGADGKYIVKRDLTERPEPTWRAMEKVAKAGLTRAIGVSNWSLSRLRSLLRLALIPPAVNQIEIHPFFPNSKLVQYCFDHGVLPVAYSPLGSQVLTCGEGEKARGSQVLRDMARKKECDIGQLLIAWGLRRGYPVLPKSFTPSRITSNFQPIKLTSEEFEAVGNAAGKNYPRFVDLSVEYSYDNFWADEEDK